MCFSTTQYPLLSIRVHYIWIIVELSQTSYCKWSHCLVSHKYSNTWISLIILDIGVCSTFCCSHGYPYWHSHPLTLRCIFSFPRIPTIFLYISLNAYEFLHSSVSFAFPTTFPNNLDIHFPFYCRYEFPFIFLIAYRYNRAM